MLHASLLPPTAKLDISLLLKSSPSPPPPSTHTPLSRSISVPASGFQAPIISSPSTSTASQYSTSTAPPNTYNATTQQLPPQQQYQQYQQPQHLLPSQRRPEPLLPTPTAGPGSAVSKRPPPAAPHPSASPAKKHNSKWGPDEDALIISLRGGGMKWEDISKRLPGRSVIACRLHYQNYLERRSPWDEEKKDKLARLYDRMKPEMWAKVAEDLQVPWRAAESMHWALGENEMARRAGVVPFSMAPAGYGEPSTANAPSSSSSTSGVDPSGYSESLPAHEYGSGVGGRPRSNLRQSSVLGEEREGGVRLGLREGYGAGGVRESESSLEAGKELPRMEGRRRRELVSEGSGDQGVVLPSLAELEGGVPAYAGFVGEAGRERPEVREGRGKRGGSQEAEEEEPEKEQ